MDLARRFEKLEKDFCKEWIHRHPLQGTALGLHDEFDDRMPDGSLEKELDDRKFLHRSLAEFQKFDPRKLAPAQATDRDLAIHAIRNWIFDREELGMAEACPEAPQVIGTAMFQLLSRNYAPLGQRMRSIMKRLEKMPKYIEQSRSKLRRPVKLFLEIELEAITRLPGFFNLIKDIGREHLPATPQRDLNRLIEHVQNVLQKYEDWLIVDVLPDCREDYSIGEELHRRLLHVRGVEQAPGSLLAAAEEDIERIKERQKEVGRAIKRKVALEDIRDLIKQQHPENFDGVLRFVRDAAGKTRQFVNRSKFVQLPEGEQVYVIETPSFLRHLCPFGGYWPPAKFEPKHDGYVFVTPGDCDSDKLKEHNYAALSTLAIREGYPGRHVMTSWAIRHPSPLRALYEDPATAGGWGQYCEERAKEMGFDDTPPSRFMQMQSGVLSAVRVVLEHKLAAGKLSAPQAVESLIDYLGMDRICAEAEARRYVTQPGVASTHYWGKARIRELKRWTKDRMEGRYAETFFHTTLLASGPIPFPLLRRELDRKIAEELRRPPDHGRDEHRKEPAHAPVAPKKARPSKPAPKKVAPKATKPRPKPSRRRR
jgi:uncharacterized protein (DUF885 family)